MGSTTDQMKVLSIPLPEEELGVGARWEVYQTLVNSGMTMYQKSEFELVAVDGRKVTLKSKLEQTAPPQAMESPELMQPWARLALDAALRARLSKPARKRSSPPAAARAKSATRRKAVAPPATSLSFTVRGLPASTITSVRVD